MPQPDSSRHRTRWNEATPWPVDPEAPRHPARPPVRLAPRPKEEPEKDGRTPDDRDGNEELEREQREQPPRRPREREAQARPSEAFENEDSGQWVATERFTFDAELDDTLPNVPRYGDDFEPS
jgi:hypothetical protein